MHTEYLQKSLITYGDSYHVSFTEWIRKAEPSEIILFENLIRHIDWDSKSKRKTENVCFQTDELYRSVDLNVNEHKDRETMDVYLRYLARLQIANDNFIFNLVENVERNEQILTFQISTIAKEEFRNIRNTMSLFSSVSVLKLFGSAQSAYLFWEMMEQYYLNVCKSRYDSFYTTEETKQIFGLSERNYRNPNRNNAFERTAFEKNVITKSIDEINAMDIGMQIACTKEKSGGSVAGYRFRVSIDKGKILGKKGE